MSKVVKKTIAICFLVLVQAIQPLVVVCAEECAVLKEQVKKERSILKRLTLYKSAVSICPDDAGLIYSYGFNLERMRKYKDALQQYQRVTELDPSNAKAFFNMGDIYRNQDKKYEAIRAYQQGLRISPENPRTEKRLRELLEETTEK
jgi:tetratricopeptide (TPR) repeat protein